MKRFHGMVRARGWGLRSISTQVKLTAIAVNIKRIASLVNGASQPKSIILRLILDILTHYQIRLQTWDFVFSLSDSFDDTFCDLLVSPEGVPFNGVEHPLPFKERMAAIQHIAGIALKYSDEVELFLSDDNPNLPDFTDFHVSCQNVAEILCQQYELLRLPFEIPSLPVKAYILCDIPSAHMIIHR